MIMYRDGRSVFEGPRMGAERGQRQKRKVPVFRGPTEIHRHASLTMNRDAWPVFGDPRIEVEGQRIKKGGPRFRTPTEIDSHASLTMNREGQFSGTRE